MSPWWLLYFAIGMLFTYWLGRQHGREAGK